MKPDTGHPRTCTGVHKRLGLRPFALIALLVSACAGPYADVLRSLDAAPSCCASMAALPYRSLVFGQRAAVELTTSSPAYSFPSGKSYFVAFKLPPFTEPYRIFIDSYLLGDSIDDAAIFMPIVLTFDGHYNGARSFDEHLFRLRSNGLTDTWGLPHKLAGTIEVRDKNLDERYLVILTREELVRSWISITPPGEAEKERIRTVPVGRLLLRLERISP